MNKNLAARFSSYLVIFSMLLSALGLPTRAVQAVILRDYGDAPDSYKTLATSGGPSHGIVPGFHLGATVDAEADGQPSALADGDDLNLVPDDEDGVSFAQPFLAPGNPAAPIIMQVGVAAPGRG